MLVLALLIHKGIFSPSFGQIDSASGWRTSWKKFSDAVVDFRDKGPSFPQCGFNSLLGGETTPTEWPVMKKFKGLVTFEGKLDSLITDPGKIMKGQPFNLSISMLEVGVPGITHPAFVYPKKIVVSKWKAIKLGSIVRFRSKVTGICGICVNEKCMYLILLTDAEILEVKK